MKRNVGKFVLDLVLAVLFAAMFIPKATGLTIHEWGGLVFGFAVVWHVVLNWKWVLAITRKMTSKGLQKKTRLSYLLNWALFLDLLVIIGSGVFISKIIVPEFRYLPEVQWLPIHIVSSVFGLLIIGMHVGLHWDWIREMGKRFAFLRSVSRLPKPALKTAAYLILILGTVTFVAQMPKQVLLTQAIFAAEGSRIENFQGRLEGPEGHTSSLERSPDRLDGSHDRERGRNDLSLLGLLLSIPGTLLYLTMIIAVAFYMRKLSDRYLKPL